jgi:ParB/RepB/Spo0J family partition protein
MKMDECRFLPLDQLVDPPVVLRLVNRGSVAYLELRDSLAHYGPLNSVCVRPSLRCPGKYDVADGLYRVTAAREIALPGFPCIIKDLTDDELLAIQVQANALRPETTPLEYARQIKRIMEARPEATLAEISSRILHKSPKWVGETLGLLGLRKDYHLAVDRGEMPLGSAYELARIPYRHQAEFLDAARTMPVAKFRAVAQAFLKQFQEAVRQGKLDAFFTEDFKPVPHMRPLKGVIAECEKPACAALVLTAERCKTLTDAWRAALAWVLHLDRESIAIQRQAVTRRSRKRAKEVLDKQR